MSTEVIGLLANIALSLSLIVAVIFGIGQARDAARDRHERLTLETLRAFSTREFAELLQYIENNDIPKTRAQMHALPVDEQKMFIQLSMQMENLGILVAERMINLDLVDKTLGSFVSTTWEKFTPIVLDMREKDDEPYMNEYFQWLAETIDARMKANPRGPYYKSHPAHGGRR